MRARTLLRRGYATRPSASEFMMEQAIEEERNTVKKAKTPGERLVDQMVAEKPWDGEETIERALRRILQDQYQPLRVKGHKKEIQKPTTQDFEYFKATSAEEPVATTSSDTPEASSSSPREPWEYTFKTPSHAQKMPLVKTGTQLPRPRKKPEAPQRLDAAYNGALDYRLSGGDLAAVRAERRQLDTGSVDDEGAPLIFVRGAGVWGSIVETRIEQARRNGQFKKIEGRGKPLARDAAEANPFISRHEFLINRVVQGQGGAPPWVELQAEMEANLSAFRASLRSDWTRRVVRTKSQALTQRDIDLHDEHYRDPEWAAQERSYHETFVKDLNERQRKYNMIAPYSVRKQPIYLEKELELCYRTSVDDIKKQLQTRLHPPAASSSDAPSGRATYGKLDDPELDVVKESMLSAFRRLVREVFSKKS